MREFIPEGLASADAATGPCPSAPPTPAAVLRAAANLIEPEGRWTQHHFARGKDGHWVDLTSEEAVCFCAEGAIMRVGGGYSEPSEVAADADRLLARLVGVSSGGVHNWNDAKGRTQAEVVAALRKAADLAEAAGAADPLVGNATARAGGKSDPGSHSNSKAPGGGE